MKIVTILILLAIGMLIGTFVVEYQLCGNINFLRQTPDFKECIK
jgi:hypothetical protein